MTKKLLTIILAGMMMMSMPGWAMAAGSGDMLQDQAQEMPQIQIQQRDRVQTQINPVDQEQARIQLRERLQIIDSAKTQMMERLRDQDQTQGQFSDIQYHWAQVQIQSAYHWGLAFGYPDGGYKPDGNITGLEGVVMMTRLMNCLTGIDAGMATNGAIDWDALPDWAKAMSQERNALRIMAQTGYYAEPKLNRYQFGFMLAKALGIEPADLPEGTVVFLDQEMIPAADLGYIQALRTLGLIVGYNGNYDPDRLVTRAEAACMLTRVLDSLGE